MDCVVKKIRLGILLIAGFVAFIQSGMAMEKIPKDDDEVFNFSSLTISSNSKKKEIRRLQERVESLSKENEKLLRENRLLKEKLPSSISQNQVQSIIDITTPNQLVDVFLENLFKNIKNLPMTTDHSEDTSFSFSEIIKFKINNDAYQFKDWTVKTVETEYISFSFGGSMEQESVKTPYSIPDLKLKMQKIIQLYEKECDLKICFNRFNENELCIIFGKGKKGLNDDIGEYTIALKCSPLLLNSQWSNLFEELK